ncbi:MAG: pyridoxal phosphate-dependent aminotransferase [Bryobacteraceae bacterium]
MLFTNGLAKRISRINVSATMRVASEAAKLKARGIDVVDFGAGEPDFPTPGGIKQAAIRAIEANFTKYTSAGGTQELKEAVCERHHAAFGTSYTPSECVISDGGKHAIFNAVQVLIDPGDEVIIPTPSWVTYKEIVRYAEAVPVAVPTDEAAGFEITAGLIERSLTPRTKAVIVNSPCNPTGAVIGDEEFERIYRLTSRNGIWLITDECYGHLVYGRNPYSVASIPGARRSAIVVGSLSKTYAMTGWRIGFALAPPPVAAAIVKLQSQSTSNPNSIAQKAAAEALSGSQESVASMLAEYQRRRDYVIGRLRDIPGVTCIEPGGAFYAYPNIKVAIGKGGIEDSLDFAQKLLDDARVAVVPGAAFGSEAHIRISYATSMHELERGLDRLQRFMAGLA